MGERRYLENVPWEPIGGEVRPTRILRIDQRHAFLTPPTLDLLLASNRKPYIAENLEVDQARYVVLAAEAGHRLLLMLQGARLNVVSHTRVQNA